MADGDRDAPVSIFHPTYLILVAGVSNAFLSGDLFNLYVGFEILLTASYVLMTLGGTGPRIRAGVTYVVVSVVSSVLFLIAIAMIYGATGTINMADLAIKLADLDQGTRKLLHVMLLVAFGIKAAVFPLSFWLPDSYPTAPAPVTAVFAGLLTKVGVYAMVRTETLLFPGDALNAPLMVAALLTMVVGILGALAQSDIKRLLSFTLVSHIGYMVFGLAMSSVAGLGAAVFYVAHHITIQTSLFLVTGLIERRGGSSSMDRVAGLAKLSPVLAVLFFIPAMNLAGIPPFSGFLGKLGLLQAGVELGTPLAYALVIGGVLTSLLTLLAIARVWNRAFWRKPEDAEHPDPVLLAAPADSATGDRARQDERHPAAADHGGLHPGPGGLRRGPDGLRRAAVQGGRPVRPGDAGPDLLHPGGAGRGRARAAAASPRRNPASRTGRRAAEMSRKRISLRQELPLLVWLVFVWGALWQNFSPGNLLFGALIAVLVARLFYLPPVELGGRFNVLRAVPFALMFLGKVVAASFQVLYLAVVRGPKVVSAVVAVPLRSHSDLLVTATGHVISLIPGSLVVEVDRSTSTLYIHGINVRNAEDAAKLRKEVRDTEAGLIRIMGTKDELSALTAGDRRMMQIVLTVTAVVLSLAAAGAIVRIARGPSLLDRVLAADVLLAIFGAALCIDMAVNRHLNNLMLLVAISLIGFIGSVTVARFVADRRERP